VVFPLFLLDNSVVMGGFWIACCWALPLTQSLSQSRHAARHDALYFVNPGTHSGGAAYLAATESPRPPLCLGAPTSPMFGPPSLCDVKLAGRLFQSLGVLLLAVLVLPLWRAAYVLYAQLPRPRPRAALSVHLPPSHRPPTPP